MTSSRSPAKRSRQARSSSKARPPRTRTRQRVAEGLQIRERVPRDARPTPRASWYRYLQAASALHDDGKPATESAIARELGISRMSLWRLHRRNPELKRWALG
jgi:hypothetical protein